MADKNTANIGFEKQIWDAACVLRGNLDASEYKSVVLGLIFLKYISDRFEDKYNQSKRVTASRKTLTNTLLRAFSSSPLVRVGAKLLQKHTPRRLAR